MVLDVRGFRHVVSKMRYGVLEVGGFWFGVMRFGVVEVRGSGFLGRGSRTGFSRFGVTGSRFRDSGFLQVRGFEYRISAMGFGYVVS